MKTYLNIHLNKKTNPILINNTNYNKNKKSLTLYQFHKYKQKNYNHNKNQKKILLSLIHQIFTNTYHYTIIYIQKSNLTIKPLFLTYLINFQN